MLLCKTDYIHFRLIVNKNILPMWLAIYWNFSNLMFMLYMISMIIYLFWSHMCLGGLIFFQISSSDLFFVCTPVGDPRVAKRVDRKCLISLSHWVTFVDSVDIDILYFDVILNMDCLHSFYASTVCRNCVVKFCFPNEHVLERKKDILCLTVSLSRAITINMISKSHLTIYLRWGCGF